jgi:hypothetical protein
MKKGRENKEINYFIYYSILDRWRKQTYGLLVRSCVFRYLHLMKMRAECPMLNIYLCQKNVKYIFDGLCGNFTLIKNLINLSLRPRLGHGKKMKEQEK